MSRVNVGRVFNKINSKNTAKTINNAGQTDGIQMTAGLCNSNTIIDRIPEYFDSRTACIRAHPEPPAKGMSSGEFHELIYTRALRNTIVNTRTHFLASNGPGRLAVEPSGDAFVSQHICVPHVTPYGTRRSRVTGSVPPRSESDDGLPRRTPGINGRFRDGVRRRRRSRCDLEV